MLSHITPEEIPFLDYSQIKTLLAKRFEKDTIHLLKQLPSPFDFKDMAKATRRIKHAIDNQEEILLVGDYDVDGVVSRVLIELFFEHINVPISSITPNRFRDGYGISKRLIEDTKAKVIITVDNGISGYEVAEYCLEKRYRPYYH